MSSSGNYWPKLTSRQFFRKILKYQISLKSVNWKQSCFMRINGRTDMTKLIVAFRNFAKSVWILVMTLRLNNFSFIQSTFCFSDKSNALWHNMHCFDFTYCFDIIYSVPFDLIKLFILDTNKCTLMYKTVCIHKRCAFWCHEWKILQIFCWYPFYV